MGSARSRPSSSPTRAAPWWVWPTTPSTARPRRRPSPSRVLTLEHAPLLFGRDPTPGLLAFDLAEGGSAIRLYRRLQGAVLMETVPFSPFLLLSNVTLVESTAGLEALEPLEGSGAFRWLAHYRSWADALGGRDRCR